MTEAEWMNCVDPTPMMQFVQDKTSDRKLRLFAVACCLRIKPLILRLKLAYRAVVIAERRADWIPVEEHIPMYRGRVAWEAFAWIDCYRTERENNALYNAGSAAAAALAGLDINDPLSSQDDPSDGGMNVSFGNILRLVGSAESAAFAAAHWQRRNDHDPMKQSAVRAERAFQVPLLRDIVGNPFRSVAFDPSWRTSTAVALAEGIYADRGFDRLSILADALEDAGCDTAELLAHLRGDGPHVRGCWALDLVLGKS